MITLFDAGYKTWASIEPIVDFSRSLKMIELTRRHCYLYKIGLNRFQEYSVYDIKKFVDQVIKLVRRSKIYFKDSLLQAIDLPRKNLPGDQYVNSDYNIFK